MAIPFSDTTNYTGLIQKCEASLFGGDYGRISGSTKLLKTFTAYLNEGLSVVSNKIANSSTRWDWHDSNYTTHPEATTTLIAGQNDYKLDDVHQQVKAIYVKDSNGVEHPLAAIDEYDLYTRGKAPESFLTEDGMPQYFDLKGRSVILYPAPAAASVTLSEGLRVSFVEAPSYFANTDTTKTAGIPPTFQHAPAEYAKWKYAEDNEMQAKAQTYRENFEQLMLDIQTHYSKRNKVEGTRGMSARRRSYK